MEIPACRACLATDKLLYSLSENTLKSTFENLVGLQINLAKDLPGYLCYICKARLHKCIIFKNKCIEVQLLLEEHAKTRKITLEFLNSMCNPCLSLQTTNTKTYPDIILNEEITQANEPQIIENSVKEYLEIENTNDDKYDDFNDSDDDQNLSELVKIKQEQPELFTLNYDENVNTEIEDMKDESKRSTAKKRTRLKKDKEDLKNLKSRRKGVKKKTVKKKSKTSDCKDRDDLKMVTREQNYYDLNRTAQTLEQFNMRMRIFTKEEQLQKFESRKEAPNYLACRYKCETCYKGFATQRAFDAHNELHKPDPRRPYECEICRIYCVSRRARRRHFEQHDREFSCAQCGERVGASGIRSHHRFHAGVKYECKTCGEVFSRHTTHQNHMRRRHGDTRCDICGHKFLGDTGRRHHMDKKHRQAVECDTCRHMFNDKAALERHLGRCTKDSDFSFCGWCGEDFPSSSELVVHQAAHAGDCPHAYFNSDYSKIEGGATVDITWTSPSYLHEKSPSKSGPNRSTNKTQPTQNLSPEEIERRRERKNERRRERRRERGGGDEKNFICDQCGVAVASRRALLEHARKHTGEKPHKCPACGRAFRVLQTLKNHVRIHTGERPFKCKLCPKDFRQFIHLSNHMLIHSDARPHACGVCHKSFRLTWALKEHVRTVHEGLPAARTKHKHNVTTQ